MLLEVEGVVLRRTKYAEHSLIVEVLTQDYDILTTFVQGLRSKAGRSHAAILQAGNVVHIVLYYKAGANMHRLKSAHINNPFVRIPFEVARGTILLFYMELTRNALPRGGTDTQVFPFAKERLYELDQSTLPLTYAPVQYSILLSEVLGFGGDCSSYSDGSYFDMQNGRFVTTIPSHPTYMSERISYLYYTLASANKDLHTLGTSREQRRTLLHQLMTYYKLHLPHFKTPNSLSILQSVFD